MTRTRVLQVLLGLGQMAAHASVIYVIFQFQTWGLAAALLMYFMMTSLGVSVTAHRFLTHRSFQLPRAFEILGSVFFTLSMQGSTIAWVAMHREHHRYSDHPRDPHCPRENWLATHFLSMFYEPKIKYSVQLVRDPFHAFIHRHYWTLNLAYAVALFLLMGWAGVVYLHLFPAFLCWHAIGVAKTMAHMTGYRNFATGDNSRNIPVLGYLTFGEAWHNNHHAHPLSYSFSHRFHEVDISALLIRFGAKFLGFTLPERVPNAPK